MCDLLTKYVRRSYRSVPQQQSTLDAPDEVEATTSHEPIDEYDIDGATCRNKSQLRAFFLGSLDVRRKLYDTMHELIKTATGDTAVKKLNVIHKQLQMAGPRKLPAQYHSSTFSQLHLNICMQVQITRVKVSCGRKAVSCGCIYRHRCEDYQHVARLKYTIVRIRWTLN